MLGLPSLGKLLLLVGAVLAVWYGFKLYARREALRKAAPPRDPKAPERVDLIECRRCRTYVPAGRRPGCDRADCGLA